MTQWRYEGDQREVGGHAGFHPHDPGSPSEKPRSLRFGVVRYFLLKQVEIVGEAAFKVEKGFKELHPELPWRKFEGTRHILVHDYFDVDWDVLWDIIHLHIEPLREQIHSLLPNTE